MNWKTIHQQALIFLNCEKQTLQRNGFDGCCAAEWDLEVLEAIITSQQDSKALSLESVLLCEMGHLSRQIARVQWRRGEPSPPEYWRLECQRAYLGMLLRHYHAFRRNGHTR